MSKPENITQEQLEAIRAARREYNRAYRKKNPERVKSWYMKYWLKKANEAKASEPEGGNNDRA